MERPSKTLINWVPIRHFKYLKKSAKFPAARTFQVVRPTSKAHNERGTAFTEFILLFPILFFLFVGAFDLGFFCYSFIAVKNAARVAALYTSSSSTHQADSAGACTNYVLPELQNMPNYASLPANCSASPLQVTAASVAAPDGTSEPASKVTVTYQTNQLIPLPVLPGQLTITAAVVMRVRT